MSDGAPKLAHWPDDCQHGVEAYVGTFHLHGVAHDVYVFDGINGREVCIRNGTMGEYWSPGTLANMRERMKCTPGFEPYASALALIEKQAPKTSPAPSKRPISQRRRKERARIVP